MQDKAEWIAAECEAGGLRVWAMAGSTVLAEASTHHEPGQTPDALRGLSAAAVDLLGAFLPDTPVDLVACGVSCDPGSATKTEAGLAFRPVPAAPLPDRPHRASSADPRLRIHLVPGLKQDRPCDLMCGDETRIAGFLARHENWDGVICLPGRNGRWAHVSANEVVSFQTFLSGEMIGLLMGGSPWRDRSGDDGQNAVFDLALSDIQSRPENLAARLFGIRAAERLQGETAAAAQARLSGLLIGAELAAARPYWLGQQIAVVGTGGFADLYVRAITAQGAPVIRADDAEMTLGGLIRARQMLAG